MFVLAAIILNLAPHEAYTKVYYEKDDHQYYQVIGYCRGEVKYTMHSEDCPCKMGKYEVKNP